MRQLFFLLFTFFSLAALAQTSTQFLGAPNTLVQNRGHLQTDSTFRNAIRDTTFTPARLGIQVYRPADSSLYISVATTVRPYWARVGSSGGNGAIVTVIRDSVFITTRDTTYYFGSLTLNPSDTLPLSTRINELVARRDTISITQLDSLHIVICQPTIGRCDTLEWSGSSGGGSGIDSTAHHGLSQPNDSTILFTRLSGPADTLVLNIPVIDTAYTLSTKANVIRVIDSTLAAGVEPPYTTGKYLNGYGQYVTLNTDSLTEGSTNLFFTNARVRAALSLNFTTTGTSGAATGSYDNATGVFTINVPQYSGGSGITYPYTTQKYLTGYGTFGSFLDSARAAITLTTTGTSGAATYSGGVLNIPQYSGGGADATAWHEGGDNKTAGWNSTIGTLGNTSFRLKAAGVEAVLIDSATRNVAIGGARDGVNKLSVIGDLRTAVLQVGGGDSMGIYLKNPIASNPYIQFAKTAGFGNYYVTTNSSGVNFANTSNPSTSTASNYVGILAGTSYFFGDLQTGSGSTTSSKIDIRGTNNAYILFNQGGTNRGVIGFNNNANIAYRVGNASSMTTGTQSMIHYGATANVGIGTSTTDNGSTLQVNGSLSLAYVSKATSYTATTTDGVIEVTATGQTITLPTAASITGRIYTVKLTASGTCTVATTSSQTIDGATTYTLSAQYKYVTVQSNGTNWNIIGNN